MTFPHANCPCFSHHSPCCGSSRAGVSYTTLSHLTTQQSHCMHTVCNRCSNAPSNSVTITPRSSRPFTTRGNCVGRLHTLAPACSAGVSHSSTIFGHHVTKLQRVEISHGCWRQLGSGSRPGPRQPHPVTFSSPKAPLTATSSGPVSPASKSTMVEVENLGILKRKVSEVESRLALVLEVADLAGCRSKLAFLELNAAGDGLWGDAARAQRLLAEIGSLRSEIQELDGFRSQLEECVFAVELLEAEASDSSSSTVDDPGGTAIGSGGGGGGQLSAEQATISREVAQTLRLLNQGLDRWDLRLLLNGPYDERGARLLISAGAGGLDAMDWTKMLERMYIRWAEQNGHMMHIIDRVPGEEAGIKSVELEVTGRYVYGHLRAEKGTHRLVRISPFNAKGLRQTSFAGVDVMPLLGRGDLPGLELNERDLDITFMRSGGKGGQNVNKVETGVRIVHIPTGLSVKCTKERTQIQNRDIAMDMLKTRLLVVLEEQNAKKVAEIRGDLVKAEWGQQIRNYVFHPYKLIKDTRTGMETSDVGAVLDGELGDFMAAYLRFKGRQAVGASLEVDEASSS